MIGKRIRILLNDGTELVVTITLLATFHWETDRKQNLLELFASGKPSYSEQAWLAWHCTKAAGHVVKLFPSWLADVKDLEFLGADDESPKADAG
jgi:hypothetical protein